MRVEEGAFGPRFARVFAGLSAGVEVFVVRPVDEVVVLLFFEGFFDLGDVGDVFAFVVVFEFFVGDFGETVSVEIQRSQSLSDDGEESTWIDSRFCHRIPSLNELVPRRRLFSILWRSHIVKQTKISAMTDELRFDSVRANSWFFVIQST